MNIPDNYDLWERHDAEQQAKLEKLPVCDYCEEPIQSDYYYEIDNECICEECLNDNFRKSNDDY
jgi:formylmethanofuran dehydrogenase subunit E